MNYLKRYLMRLLIWLTQSLNVWLGPVFDAALFIAAKRYQYKTKTWPPVAWFGDEDETTSSVLGKNSHWSTACVWICKKLDVLLKDKYHCQESIEHDEGSPWKDERARD